MLGLERLDLSEMERIAAKVKNGEPTTPEEDEAALLFIDAVQKELIPAVLDLWNGIRDALQTWLDAMIPATEDVCEQLEAAAKRTDNDSHSDAATREPI